MMVWYSVAVRVLFAVVLSVGRWGRYVLDHVSLSWLWCVAVLLFSTRRKAYWWYVVMIGHDGWYYWGVWRCRLLVADGLFVIILEGWRRNRSCGGLELAMLASYHYLSWWADLQMLQVDARPWLGFLLDMVSCEKVGTGGVRDLRVWVFFQRSMESFCWISDCMDWILSSFWHSMACEISTPQGIDWADVYKMLSSMLAISLFGLGAF